MRLIITLFLILIFLPSVTARTAVSPQCTAQGSCYCKSDPCRLFMETCKLSEYPQPPNARCYDNPLISYRCQLTDPEDTLWCGKRSGDTCIDCTCYGCSCEATGYYKCSCDTNYEDCDSDFLGDGCETNILTDPENCGGCDILCNNPSYCESDDTGEHVCGCISGSCIDTCGDEICQPTEDITTCSYDCNEPPTIIASLPIPEIVDAGDPVEFSVEWSDPNPGDGISLYVCKNNDFSGSCQNWCEWSTTLESPTNCFYTSQMGDSSTNNFFVFLCDSYSYKSCASAPADEFMVNHPPSIVSASSNADELFGEPPGENIIFNMKFTDDPGDTVKMHVCKTDVFDDCDSNWCQSLTFGLSPRACPYTVKEKGYQTNPYYIFAVDERGLVSDPVYGEFYEDRDYRIGKFLLRRVYSSRNTPVDVPIKVMNKQIDQVATITLSIEGTGEFRPVKTKNPVTLENNGHTAVISGIQPQTSDIILVSMPPLAPRDGESYKITLLKSESDVEPFPETDTLEITPYFVPSFDALGVFHILILIFAAIGVFASKNSYI